MKDFAEKLSVRDLIDEEIDNLIEPATGLPNGKAVSRGKVVNHSF